MAFRLIPADQRIVDSVKLFMDDPAPPGSSPVDGWPLGSGEIPIQFPPRVKSKNKSGNFQLKDEKGFYEPVAIWKGASGTQISVELKYVVTSNAQSVTPWTISRISDIVHNVMGYFYRNVNSFNKGAQLPLIQVRLYKIIPEVTTISKWRIESAQADYSDELIIDGKDIYPQVTTITLTMMMVTQIRPLKEKAKQRLDAPERAKKEWY